MARTHVVASARKAQGNCRSCGKAINAGDAYKWAKPRYRGKVVVCGDCQITVSMTSSSKMVAVWEAQTEFGKIEASGDIGQGLRDLAETARGVGEEYQESADNQRQTFPDAEVADENEQKAQDLESWADELETAADEADGAVEELDTLTSEKDDLESEQSAFETERDSEGITEERKAEVETRLDEIETRISEIENEINDKESDIETAKEVADNCPG